MYCLYYSPGACSLAAHIALEEIGVAYELQLRSAVAGKDTQSPEYLALNPKGRVPALATVAGSSGGAPGLLTELPAILVYLARAHPDAALLPADNAPQARCLEWMNWLSGTVHGMSYGQIWRPQRYNADVSVHAGIVQKGRDNLQEQHAYIESLLSDGRPWAVPAGYSVVESYLLVMWLWGHKIGMEMSSYCAWQQLMQKVAERAAVQRVLEQEGLALPA